MQRRDSFATTRRIIIGIIALIVGGALAYLRWHGMPSVAWSALRDADRYELISLNPDRTKGEFYGHEVLDGVLVGDAKTRRRLNQALQSGVRASDGTRMACFNPRHGIRVTHADVTTDFVICFECRQVQVWRAGQQIAFFLVSDSPQRVFDDVLGSAGVSPSPKGPSRH